MFNNLDTITDKFPENISASSMRVLSYMKCSIVIGNNEKINMVVFFIVEVSLIVDENHLFVNEAARSLQIHLRREGYMSLAAVGK